MCFISEEYFLSCFGSIEVVLFLFFVFKFGNPSEYCLPFNSPGSKYGYDFGVKFAEFFIYLLGEILCEPLVFLGKTRD